MPPFVSLIGNLFTIAPTLTLLPASYPILVSIFDGAMTTTSTFNVIVINDPPVFIQALADQTIYIGSSIIYQLPTAIDPEGNTVQLMYSILPSFASLSGLSQFTFNPT